MYHVGVYWKYGKYVFNFLGLQLDIHVIEVCVCVCCNVSLLEIYMERNVSFTNCGSKIKVGFVHVL